MGVKQVKRVVFGLLVAAVMLNAGGVMAAETVKRAVMIIAHEGFRDEELKEPKAVLESAGIDVDVASSSIGEAKGMLGYKVKPDILVSDINIDDYEAIILVGGLGAKEYWEDSRVHALVKDASAKGKVVAAICIAPVTLAKAGVLEGKKATVFSSENGQLKNCGAIHTGKAVQVDGNIVTANGPGAADEFGKGIVELLSRAEQ